MTPIIADSMEEFEKLRSRPPADEKVTSKDAKENLVYILQKVFEVPGHFGQSEIVAVSTDKKMIFSVAKVLARQEFYKPKVLGQELGKWDFIVLIYDNASGKFLDKVEIPRFKE